MMKQLFVAALGMVLLGLPGITEAQNQNTRERILPVQAGTVQTVNGQAAIDLTAEMQSYLAGRNGETDYVVVCTPHGEATVWISEKNAGRFVVQTSQLTMGVGVDYVVYLRQPVAKEARTLADPK